MTSFKTGIPVTWIVLATSQIAQTLQARNTLVDVPIPDVDKYRALTLFGGVGEFTGEDEAMVKKALTDIADTVSTELYLINNGKKEVGKIPTEEFVNYDDAMSIVLNLYGYRDLLAEAAPHLV